MKRGWSYGSEETPHRGRNDTDPLGCIRYHAVIFFFFFQAEDGIRDLTVTGVQTCALPILPSGSWHQRFLPREHPSRREPSHVRGPIHARSHLSQCQMKLEWRTCEIRH